jgi:hypothetical protein
MPIKRDTIVSKSASEFGANSSGAICRPPGLMTAVYMDPDKPDGSKRERHNN